MCLATEQLEPFIATEDLVVYKKVLIYQNYIRSYFQDDFEWNLNTLYETYIEKLFPPDEDYCCTYDSITTEKYYKRLLNIRNYGDPEDIIVIKHGFHSIFTEERMLPLKESGDSIAKCIIPKGSQYYLDSTGLAVSNKLIMLEILA